MSFPIIPKLNSAPGAGAPATLTLGELAANRSTAKLYMGTDTGVQELAFAGSLGGTAISTFTASGGTSFSPINGYTSTSVDAYLVSVGGIEQRPTVDWTISSAAGGTVVFATAPPAGVSIVVRAVVAGSGGSGGADIGGRAWSGTATYTEGDLVATDQTSTWICIQADNTGNDPATSPTWWARMPASAVQLQFRPLAETAPTDGQAIVWNAALNQWEPQIQQGIQGVQGDQGIQGIQGDQGVQGVQGVQGDQGAKGDQGVGFSWKGNFVLGDPYFVNDIIFYDGFFGGDAGAYICISPVQGAVPPGSVSWNRFA